MGGIGSGRRCQGGKNVTTDYRALDVRQLQRDGLLEPGQEFGWNWYREGEKVASIDVRTETDRVHLDYRYRRHGQGWKDENYPVLLDWTPCTYGGNRAWFLCPAAGCGKRVAILYGGAGIFACRHCRRLAYPSQRENVRYRAIRQADKLRNRLGWELGILNGHGGIPKGMHRLTYLRLIIKYDAIVDTLLNYITPHQKYS